eukprot:364053-Chlamydomonas_euryale.AAC.1
MTDTWMDERVSRVWGVESLGCGRRRGVWGVESRDVCLCVLCAHSTQSRSGAGGRRRETAQVWGVESGD